MPQVSRCVAVLSLVFLSSWGAATVRAGQLSDSEIRIYHDAFAAAKAGEWSAAWRTAQQGHDKLLETALRWDELMHGGGNGLRFADFADFISRHPDWPGQAALQQHAEEAMAGAADAGLAEWFAHHPPVTPAGKLREAQLAMDQGHTVQAVALIREVWIDGDFNRIEERSLLQRYHTVLRSADHVARLDRLLWDGDAEAARRMYRLVEPEYRALAEARLGLAAMAPGVERLVARVPAKLQHDPGLLYERMRWRRRKGHYDDAIALLEAAPKEMVRPAAWAVEREVLARYALAEGKTAIAYRIAARHGLSSGAHFAELEFLAGWIALRLQHQPETAYNHFVHLYQQVKLPISLARGAYWSARAAEALGKRQLAENWYATAAQEVTTYYGQLASAHLGNHGAPESLAEPQPSAEEIAAFDRRELVRLTRALAEIGAEDLVRPFVRQLSLTADGPDDHLLVARLAGEIDRPDLAIAAAKQAGYAGVTLLNEGYPISDLPPGGTVEHPLLLAMTRQESAFDGDAVSSAGARGMMQLMPATASQLAKSLRMPFSLSRLTGDVRYNLTLGREYLAGLLSDFAGSYVLAVAAYNAGPARVRQWLHDYGDPRTKGVDVIDWIESIPAAETRNYVQRVLENLQIYRVRLGDHQLAFSLTSDLRR